MALFYYWNVVILSMKYRKIVDELLIYRHCIADEMSFHYGYIVVTLTFNVVLLSFAYSPFSYVFSLAIQFFLCNPSDTSLGASTLTATLTWPRIYARRRGRGMTELLLRREEFEAEVQQSHH